MPSFLLNPLPQNRNKISKVFILRNSELFGVCMERFNAIMRSLGAWIKKEEERKKERKICSFSEMLRCALGRIWRYLLGCVGSVWPVDCISRISFELAL